MLHSKVGLWDSLRCSPRRDSWGPGSYCGTCRSLATVRELALLMTGTNEKNERSSVPPLPPFTLSSRPLRCMCAGARMALRYTHQNSVALSRTGLRSLGHSGPRHRRLSLWRHRPIRTHRNKPYQRQRHAHSRTHARTHTHTHTHTHTQREREREREGENIQGTCCPSRGSSHRIVHSAAKPRASARRQNLGG